MIFSLLSGIAKFRYFKVLSFEKKENNLSKKELLFSMESFSNILILFSRLNLILNLSKISKYLL